jgi:excinuclease ABC subunit C
MDYKEKIKELPRSPGVYIMKDSSGAVLYVGKAGNLRKRVSSYFNRGRKHPDRIEALVRNVRDIAHIPTSSEAEALIYENSLIKQLSPKYNVALRDDKSYPMLKLTVFEKFPRISITREKKNDGSIYYGPYTDVKLLRKALLILRQMFPLRNCGKMKKNPCLYYHIKQCMAPCAGMIGETGYGEIVSELKLFLEGRTTELLKQISCRMIEASRAENFEEAANYRSRLEALGSIRQKAVRYTPAAETEELGAILGIRRKIEKIEAFDVSNIMGKSAVGSMIYYYKGMPDKDQYRRFRIKTVAEIDDYAMIREIVKRRYSRLLKEKGLLPDLILIDGGKGHLSSAAEELDALGLFGIPVIGIAKEFERIYLKGRKEPIILPRESKALHLVERIRDEAHRFAISYHKKLLSKKMKQSGLDDIPGIGEKRKKALMSYFGDRQKLRSAKLEELLKVKGMNEKSARNIIRYFKEQ